MISITPAKKSIVFILPLLLIAVVLIYLLQFAYNYYRTYQTVSTGIDNAVRSATGMDLDTFRAEQNKKYPTKVPDTAYDVIYPSYAAEQTNPPILKDYIDNSLSIKPEPNLEKSYDGTDFSINYREGWYLLTGKDKPYIPGSAIGQIVWRMDSYDYYPSLEIYKGSTYEKIDSLEECRTEIDPRGISLGKDRTAGQYDIRFNESADYFKCEFAYRDADGWSIGSSRIHFRAYYFSKASTQPMYLKVEFALPDKDTFAPELVMIYRTISPRF